MHRLAKGLALAGAALALGAPPAAAAPGNTRISTIAGGGNVAPSTTYTTATSLSLDQPTNVKSFGGDDYAYISDATCRDLLLSFDAGKDTGTLGYNVGASVGAGDACTGSASSPGALGSPGAMFGSYSWGHPCCFADYSGGALITANTDYGRVEEDSGAGRIVTVAGSTLASGCGTASPPAAPDNVDASTVQFCKITSLDINSAYGDFLIAEAHRQNDTAAPGTGKGDLYSVTGAYPGPPGAYTVHHLTGNFRIATAIYNVSGGVDIADGHGAVIRASDGTVIAGQYNAGNNTGNTGFGGDGESAVANSNVLLDAPSGLASGWDGELFIADTNNCRIRYLDTNDLGAHIHTFAGNGCQGSPPADIGDGGPAGNAYVGHVMGMVMTPRGLLIADKDSNRIRLIDHTSILTGPSGTIATHTPGLTFASLDSSPRFTCKLDGNDIGACDSPFTLPSTGDGQHTLAVWDAGHAAESSQVYWAAPADPSPATRSFTIDTTPPQPFQLQQPDANATVAGPSPTFTWAKATDATSSIDHYELWIDGKKDRDVPTSACLGDVCSAQPASPLTEADHKWQVRAVDAVGNTRSSDEWALTVGSPPAASFIVSPNPALVGRAVTFDASASSDASGIARHEWDLDGDGSFETDGGGSPTTSRVYTAPATVLIGLKVTDGVGKTSSTTQSLKITAPPGNSLIGVSINSGAQFTRDPHVKLLVKAPASATGILVSNDGGFLAPQTFPIATSIPWTLDSSGPERLPKTVYARFMLGPIISVNYTDDIILDEIPPVVQKAAVTPLGAPTGAAVAAVAGRKWKVKVKATDSNSGVGGLQVTANKRKPGKVLHYKKTLTVKAATRPKFVRARDRAGNFSPWKKAR